MTTIETNGDGVTLITVFTVDPDQQQELIDGLIEVTETTIQDVPGYVSDNIHRSSTASASPTTLSGKAGVLSKRCSMIRR